MELKALNIVGSKSFLTNTETDQNYFGSTFDLFSNYYILIFFLSSLFLCFCVGQEDVHCY